MPLEGEARKSSKNLRRGRKGVQAMVEMDGGMVENGRRTKSGVGKQKDEMNSVGEVCTNDKFFLLLCLG